MSPGPAFLLGALVLALAAAPLVLWLRRQWRAAEARAAGLEAKLEAGRRILAAAPDGLYLWDLVAGTQHCSRRLAVLLDLAAGTEASIEDVLYRFEGEAAAVLHQAVVELRRDGAAFDLVLDAAGGRRSVHAVGARCADAEGAPLADLLWMRDAGGAAAAPDPGTEAEAVRALLDALPIPVWLRDAELEVAFANRAAGDGAIAHAGRDLAARVEAGGTAVAEPRLVGDDDGARLWEITEAPLGAGPGTLGFAMGGDAAGQGTDAGDLGAEARILENLPTALAIFGADTRLRFFNPAYAALWHLDAAWLATRPDLGQVLERLREGRRLPEFADFRAFKDEQLARFKSLEAPLEDVLHLPDDTTLHGVTSRHPAGGLVFAFEDVTDRLALERSFNTLLAVQRETLDNLHEGVAVFGSDGRLSLANPVFARLWNIDDAAAGGDAALHVTEFVERMRPYLGAVADWGGHKQRVTARLMGRQAASGRLERSDATVLEYANVPLPDGAMLLSYLDVTDRFRVEQALRQRAQAMTEADRLKSEFIANVSHEIRTPLTTVIGFAEVLAEEYFGGLNARQAEYSRGILETSRGLLSVVDDILDLATIEAGMMTLELDTVEVHAMLAAVLALIRERARHKGLTLEFDCAPDLGWIVIDEKRLKQVVFNLLSNAVKFTPAQGRVGLAAERRGDEIVITVRDTGVGVPAADQQRVFATFERDLEAGGTGLGLALVQRFVELHGGSVDMRSQAGKGTTVTCTIPAGGGGA